MSKISLEFYHWVHFLWSLHLSTSFFFCEGMNWKWTPGEKRYVSHLWKKGLTQRCPHDALFTMCFEATYPRFSKLFYSLPFPWLTAHRKYYFHIFHCPILSCLPVDVAPQWSSFQAVPAAEFKLHSLSVSRGASPRLGGRAADKDLGLCLSSRTWRQSAWPSPVTGRRSPLRLASWASPTGFRIKSPWVKDRFHLPACSTC